MCCALLSMLEMLEKTDESWLSVVIVLQITTKILHWSVTELLLNPSSCQFLIDPIINIEHGKLLQDPRATCHSGTCTARKSCTQNTSDTPSFLAFGYFWVFFCAARPPTPPIVRISCMVICFVIHYNYFSCHTFSCVFVCVDAIVKEKLELACSACMRRRNLIGDEPHTRAHM